MVRETRAECYPDVSVLILDLVVRLADFPPHASHAAWASIACRAGDFGRTN